MNYPIVRLSASPEWKEEMAEWFAEKWGIPVEAYRESMEEAIKKQGPVPEWYVATDGGKIVGGLGVIENDFHDRKDLRPNVCAVFTEPEYRGQGIAGALLARICADLAAEGVKTLYLLTNHDSFYERYGWEYFTAAMGDGEETPSRVYRKTTELSCNP